MIKSVFKEIIIVLLLIIAIILLLGILLYQYMPNSKTIPTKVQEYALEETVKQELDKELNNLNSEEIVKTYRIDSSDMDNYERTNDYDKGKVNPFAEYSTDADNSGTNNNSNSNSNNNSTSGNSSSGNFLNSAGK